MPKNKIIVVLGVLIALLPIFGFPHTWEAVFQVIAGLGIVLVSVWSTIDRRISLKAKAQRRQLHKNRTAEIVEESQMPARLQPDKVILAGDSRSGGEAERQVTQEQEKVL